MRRWAPAVASLALAACGGGMQGGLGSAFSSSWQNDSGKSITALAARIGNNELPPGAAVAVGVTPKGLVGIGLDGSGRWTRAGAVDARPTVAGGVVVATGGGKLFALDAHSGNPLWAVPSDGRALRGAGDDGTLTVASLGDKGGGNSELVAVDRSGNVKLRMQPTVEIGTPAVMAGTLFVPWGNQYVSAIDVASHDEVARLLMRDQVSQAVQIGTHLYFGESALVRFDQDIGKVAVGHATHVALPQRELPGSPKWLPSGEVVQEPTANARDSIDVYARPDASGASIQGGRFAATYFRIAMGLGASDGALAWVRTLPAPALGGAAADGGFAICDAAGKVWLVGADNGGDAGSVGFGEPVQACVVQAGAFKVPAGKPTGSLAEQISQAVELNDAQMVVAQRFLLRELGQINDPIVTKLLIDLASSARTPPMILDDAKKLLAARRTGAEYMIEALGRQYDFLSDVLRPPPVAPLADALAAMGKLDAAPLLAKHLNDPADSTEDIQHAAKALVKLATPAQFDDLKTFFSLYRATAEQPPLVDAVISVAEALVRIGGEDGKKLVENAAADPLTQPDVRRGLMSLVPAGKAG